MPTLEQVQALGREIERLLEANKQRYPSVTALAEAASMSNTRLGDIMRAYQHPSRGFTVPSDEVLDRLAQALDVPVSRFHVLLGRMPDMPYPVFEHSDTLSVAEAYDRLPDFGKKMLRDMLKIVEETVAHVSEREHRLSDPNLSTDSSPAKTE